MAEVSPAAISARNFRFPGTDVALASWLGGPVDAASDPKSVPHSPRCRCSSALRTQAAADGWAPTVLIDAIVEHCGHSRLRAQRLAHGWTIDDLVSRIRQIMGPDTRLAAATVSRWETSGERPSPAYLDALCQVYRTDLAGIGGNVDHSGHGQQQAGDHEDRGPLAGPADQLRRNLDATLSATTVSDATIDQLLGVADQYGRLYKTRNHQPGFLADLFCDLEEAWRLTDRQLPTGQRRDLCSVIARLSGLVSMVAVNRGQHRQARQWLHTARLAADETADPHLRAWVATRAAVTALHLGAPVTATAVATEAELLTRRHPSRLSCPTPSCGGSTAPLTTAR
ncbi:hypothetical protein Acy02nite_89670 [Actinoplanes cyaneus]|uniref:HTH cro/C1-type domain-containing protein n=1 Tax=Actinoplanes cyaneus TaxID=52696 RepID=A0A919ITP1_9ACTN|nr:hypothetical protein Acy02nite_89670 [Actinoplanes cyaneus]